MSRTWWRPLAGDLVVLVLVAYPVLVPWMIRGLGAVFAYLAADAFVYLAIADASRETSFFTMDGQHPTNGFHPLWQGVLGVAFRWTTSQEAQLHLALALSLVFAAVGLILVRRAVARLTGSLVLSLMAVVPGWYALLVSPVQPHYGSSWSFVNGMESPLSLFCFGMFLVAASRRPLTARHLSMTRVTFLMILATSMTFSRLDDGAMLLGLGALLFVELGVKGLSCAAIPAVSLGIYVAWNVAYCGMALPVSAMAKSAPALLQNLSEVVGVLVPFRLLLHPGEAVWSDVSWRALQLVVPAAMAVFTMTARTVPARHAGLLGVLSAHILIRSLHSLSSSNLSSQGHWYFAVSILSFNVLVSYHLARFSRFLWVPRGIAAGPNRFQGAAGGLIAVVVVGLGALGLFHLAFGPELPVRKRLVSTAGAVLLVLVGAWWIRRRREFGHFPGAAAVVLFLGMRAASFCDLKMRPEYNSHYLRLFEERQRLGTELGGEGVVEMDDGILAYALPGPGLNGLGFAMDREAYEARRDGKLLELAERRGIRRLGSLNYFRAVPGEDPASLRERLGRTEALSRQDLAGFEFTVRLHDPVTGVTILEFARRDQ